MLESKEVILRAKSGSGMAVILIQTRVFEIAQEQEG